MIILIGGGEILDGETLHIDKKFLELAGGDQSVIAFFPTAANDDEQYVEGFSRYVHELGCKKVVPIYLNKVSDSEIEFLLNNVTGIYFGGGDPRLIVDACSRLKIRERLIELHNKGVVIAGMSAGAMAVCDYFLYPDASGDHIMNGLGIQNSILTVVHYDDNRDQETVKKLEEISSNYQVIGIAEKEAVLVDGDLYTWL